VKQNFSHCSLSIFFSFRNLAVECALDCDLATVIFRYLLYVKGYTNTPINRIVKNLSHNDTHA